MPLAPPAHLVDLIEERLSKLLRVNPLATSSEAYVRETVELAVVKSDVEPRYGLRIGINYHGQQVQHIQIGPDGQIVGWNSGGRWDASGSTAKMRLGGYTIFPRLPDEQLMSDAKFYGGHITPGRFIRCEFKVRGWLGKTRNLDGNQLLKDFELLAQDRADLLIICLSEVAYRKWRGEGPQGQVIRRVGLEYFTPVLPRTSLFDPNTSQLNNRIDFVTPRKTADGWEDGPRQAWVVRRRKVVASQRSVMPGAEHYIVLCWRPED